MNPSLRLRITIHRREANMILLQVKEPHRMSCLAGDLPDALAIKDTKPDRHEIVRLDLQNQVGLGAYLDGYSSILFVVLFVIPL